MNNNFIASDYARSLNINFESTENKNVDLKEGEVLQARVSEDSADSERVRIEFENGESVSVDRRTIKAEAGEEISVKIEKNSRGKVVIKQLEGEKTNNISRENSKNSTERTTAVKTDINVLLSKINVAYTKENAAYAKFLNENNIAVKAENIKTLAEIKKNIEYIAKNADENVIEKIEAAGIDTGKLSPKALSEFIYEIKNNNFDFGLSQNVDYEENVGEFEKISEEEAKLAAKEFVEKNSSENLKDSENKKITAYNRDKGYDSKQTKEMKKTEAMHSYKDKYASENYVKNGSDNKNNYSDDTEVKESEKRPADKNTSVEVKEPEKRPVDKNTSAEVKEPEKRPVDKNTSAEVKEPEKRPTDKNTSEGVKEPEKRPVDKNTSEVKEPKKRPTDKNTSVEVKEPEKRPTDKNTSAEVKELEKRPVDKNTSAEVKEPEKRPTDKNTSAEVKEPEKRPTDKNTSAEVKEPKKRPTDKNTSAEVKEPEKRPVDKNTSEVKEPEKRPTDKNTSEVKEPEKRPTDKNTSAEVKEPEKRPVDKNTSAEVKEPEKRPTDKNTSAEVKEPEKRPVDKNTSEVKEPERRPVDKNTSDRTNANKNEDVKSDSTEYKSLDAEKNDVKDINYLDKNELKETKSEDLKHNENSSDKKISETDEKTTYKNKNHYVYNKSYINFFNKRHIQVSDSETAKSDINEDYKNTAKNVSEVRSDESYSVSKEKYSENADKSYVNEQKTETDKKVNDNNRVKDESVYEDKSLEVKNEKDYNSESAKTDDNKSKLEDVDIEKIQNKYDLSKEEIEIIVKNIIKEEIPLNERNIEIIASAYSKAENISELSQKTILNLIKSGKDMTVQNIYIAEYTSKNDVNAKNISEKQWKQLKDEVIKLFEREKIDVTKENISLAKDFIENGIPVTKENIEKAEFLKNIKPEKDIDKITEKAAENIKLGKRAEDVDLFKAEVSETKKSPQVIFEDYKEIIKIIPKINTSVIKEVIKKEENLTLENLKNEFLKDDKTNDDVYEDFEKIENVKNEKPEKNHEYKTDVKDYEKNKSEYDKKVQNAVYEKYNSGLDKEISDKSSLDKELSPEVITAKRQLAEIQLKLTVEASFRLAGKGIDINVMPIKDAVEELKKLEKEAYESNLKIAGAEVSDKNVRKMSELFEKVNSLAPEYSNNVYRDIITKNIDFTIDGIDAAVSARFEKIADTLDTFATMPSQKFGDVFAAVSDQLSHVLELNGIEINEENVDAAKILSLNNMDVTSDNILQAKNINFKVSKTYNSLHPLVAAEMIKDGLNPVDMNIDDVISYIDKFEDKYTQDSKSRIAENIMKVAENNEISENEKNAVISVYRMLDMISKHSGAAIGTAMKNNVSLTLGNLMEASKVFEKTKSKKDFDVSVNDRFGLTEDIVVPDKNIRASIEKAVSSNGRKNVSDGVNLKNSSDAFDMENNMPTAEFSAAKTFSPVTTEEEYMNTIFEEIVRSADPAKITEIIKSGNSPASETIERFFKNIKKARPDNNISFNRENIRAVMEQIKQASSSPTNVISWLDKNNIPLTMTNFGIAANLIKNPFKAGKDLEKFEKNSKDNKISFGSKISSASLDALKNGKSPEEVIDDIIEDVEGAFEAIMGVEETQELDLLLKQASNIKKSLAVQKEINKSDSGFYQLPVRMSGGNIVNLNMYVMENGLNENSKTFMSFETESLGVIQVYMTMEEDNISLEINSEYSDGAKALFQYGEELKTILSESGFNVKKLQFGEEYPKNIADEKVFEKKSQKNVKKFDNLYEIIV